MGNIQQEPDESKFCIMDDGTYIKKSGNFYKAFHADGTEISEALIPLNICIMSLKGMLPEAVRVYPRQEMLEIDSGLRAILSM
jgi:hypothetical protein